MHIRMHDTAQWLGHGIVIFADVVVNNSPQASSSLGVLLGLSRDLP